MIIDTILSLDTASFQTGMGRAVQGVQSFVGIIQGLSGKMQGAFDLGGSLSDTSSILGESAGNVMILQRAFENAGLGAEAMEGSLLKMRKELASTDNFGKASNKTFEKLGLNVEKIKDMKGEQQIQSIAAAIMGLPNASDKAAASMEIFGKGGGKMLALFSDGSGFDQARQQLGGLPALMDRNAAAFDTISDRIGSIKKKSMGLWAGFAEGMLPAADYISGLFDSIDLTGIGQQFGRTMMTMIEMVKGEKIGDILYNGITSAFQLSVDYGLKAFKHLTNFLITDVVTPVSEAFTWMFDKVMLPDRAARESNVQAWGKVFNAIGLGSITGKYIDTNMADIAERYKQGDPDQYIRSTYYTDGVSSAAEFYKGFTSTPIPELFGKNTSEQQNWATMWDKYKSIAEGKIGDVQRKARDIKPFGDTGTTTTPQFDVKEQKSVDVKSDALAKVGGFLGGFNIMGGMLQLAKDSLDVQRGILNAVKQQRGGAKFA